MNRLLLIGATAALLMGSTGCLHHNTRASQACEPVSNHPGDGCEACGTKSGSGLLGKLGGVKCQSGSRTGCVPVKLGWQRGGHDYSSRLIPGNRRGNPANGSASAAAAAAANAYPYYTNRSPRDFLTNNPPTIGY
jgi:hypothetical protein